MRVCWGGVTSISLALSHPFCSVGTLLLAFEHDGISLDLWRRVGGLILISTGILYVFLVRAFVAHTCVSIRFETADRANHRPFRRLRRERGFERLSLLFRYGDTHFSPGPRCTVFWSVKNVCGLFLKRRGPCVSDNYEAASWARSDERR